MEQKHKTIQIVAVKMNDFFKKSMPVIVSQRICRLNLTRNFTSVNGKSECEIHLRMAALTHYFRCHSILLP